MPDIKYITLAEMAPNPENPRENIFNESLAASIKEIGMQDPITVRKVSKEDEVPPGVKYIVIDGDCRFDALCSILEPTEKLLVGKDILIKEISREEAFDINVSLNLQRENYSLREECNIVQHYKDLGLSQRVIAKKCNRSKIWVQDRINFLGVDSRIQLQILSGELNLSYYRTKVPDVGQLEDDSTEEDLFKKEPKATEAARTITLTRKQYDTFLEQDADFEKKIAAHQIIGDSVKVIFKNMALFYNTIQQILDNRESTPLTKDQLIRFTDLTAEEIERVLEPEEATEKEIIKPPRFSVGGKTFLEFKDSFPNLSLINIFDTGSFVGFDIDFQDSDEEELVFEWLEFHKYPPPKLTEADRTSKYYTRDFDHLIENGPGSNDLLLSKQIIGDSVTIIWKTEKTKDLMDLWIENNSIPFDDIISERIEQLEEEPREENLKEAFMEISVLENQSLLASLKALVTEEEPLESGKIRLWFRSWNDTKLIDRYLEPSRFWTIPALDYPAATVLTTNLKDILIDEKQLKAHFEEVFQELTVIQKDTKKLNQISLRTIEEITLAAARLKVFSEEIFEDLKLLKSQRRISNGHVQHQKICQSCLQPKWLESKKTICSNCELNHRQQEKNNAAAASDSGGSL